VIVIKGEHGLNGNVTRTKEQIISVKFVPFPFFQETWFEPSVLAFSALDLLTVRSVKIRVI